MHYWPHTFIMESYLPCSPTTLLSHSGLQQASEILLFHCTLWCFKTSFSVTVITSLEMCNRLLVRCWYLLYLLDFFVVILRKSDFVLACAGSLWWFEAGWAKGRGWAAGQLPALYVLYLFFSLSLCSLHHSIFLIRFFAGLQCVAVSFHFMRTWVFIRQRPPPSLPGLTFLSSLHHHHFFFYDCHVRPLPPQRHFAD